MYPSRFVHMFPRQRDLMGFDEVRERLCCLPRLVNAANQILRGKYLFVLLLPDIFDKSTPPPGPQRQDAVLSE